MKHESFNKEAAQEALADEASANVHVVEAQGKRKSRTLHRFRQLMFSSLTRRIVILNLTALAVLLSGILYLNQFREGLVSAYKASLIAQGKIIASAIASSAVVDTDDITIDPDKLLELEAGESVTPSIRSLDSLTSPIDPERIAPFIKSLTEETGTRARIYDQEGGLILDSRFLYSGGQVLRYNLPKIDGEEEGPRFLSSKWLGNILKYLLRSRDLAIYKEYPNSGLNYPEVVAALTGAFSSVDRVTQKGEQIVSVALPIQKLRVVSGVLLLSTEGDVIDSYITSERLAILRIFLVAAIVIILLSVLLAAAIATPLRKLSEAALRVRREINTRETLPDFSDRQDEIGTLSTSMREMTDALYARIEAIERFAADVSHELKNPLTSLRSAVETLPLAKTQDAKDRLTSVIQHDVQRLDRLITDISDASRLDAELARDKSDRFDLKTLVENIVSMSQSDKFDLALSFGDDLRGKYEAFGHEGRIAQVIVNLIENAKSFIPSDGGKIHVHLEHLKDTIQLTIVDNGPGIPLGKFERIFERFYTDRPDGEQFGQNSGLGLSISKQIIEAHDGTIKAENLTGDQNGAKFTVNLPIFEEADKQKKRRSVRQRKPISKNI